MSAVAAVRLQEESAVQAPDFSLIAAREAFGELEGWAMSDQTLRLPEHEVVRLPLLAGHSRLGGCKQELPI
jgi:hypothetical protein